MSQFPHLELGGGGVMAGSLPGWRGLSESAGVQPGTTGPVSLES